MTIFDIAEYDDSNEGYVATPARTPDLADALISAAAKKGYVMHIRKAVTIDENRHDDARTSVVDLHGHMAPAWSETLPAVLFDARFVVTYNTNDFGVPARKPIVELTALDITDATDDDAIATAVAVVDDTNAPRVRGSLDSMDEKFITLIADQMERLRCVKDKVPHDLTEKAITEALAAAANTTGITIDVHDIKFDTDHGAAYDQRSPMTIVRGEISLRKLDHIASKFTITFDADTPTPATASTITVHDMDIELLPHVDDTVRSAFEACDIRITGLRDDAFALVAHMFTSQIQRYMANVTGILPEAMR